MLVLAAAAAVSLLTNTLEQIKVGRAGLAGQADTKATPNGKPKRHN